MVGFAGVIAIDCKLGKPPPELVTVKVVEPVTLPEVALIVALPAATALPMPLLLMVAMDWLEELHAADAVKSLVLPSL